MKKIKHDNFSYFHFFFPFSLYSAHSVCRKLFTMVKLIFTDFFKYPVEFTKYTVSKQPNQPYWSFSYCCNKIPEAENFLKKRGSFSS